MPQRRRTFPLQDYVWVKQGKGEHSGRRQRVSASAIVGKVVSKSSNGAINGNGDTRERQPSPPLNEELNVYMIVSHNDFRTQAMVDCYKVKWCSSGKWDYVPVADCRPMYSDTDAIASASTGTNMEQHSSSVLLDAAIDSALNSASDSGATPGDKDKGGKQSAAAVRPPPSSQLRRSSHRAVHTPDRFCDAQAQGLMPPPSTKKRKVAASTTPSYPTVDYEAKIQKPQALSSSKNGRSQNHSLQSVLPNQFVQAPNGTKRATVVVPAPPQPLSIVNGVAVAAPASAAANPVDNVAATDTSPISPPEVMNNLEKSLATADATTTARSATKARANDKADSALPLDEMDHDHAVADIDESDQNAVASAADTARARNMCKPVAVAANYAHPKSSVTSKTTTSSRSRSRSRIAVDTNGKKNVDCPFCMSGTTSSLAVAAAPGHGHVYRKAGIVGDSQFYNRYRHLPDSVQLAPLRHHRQGQSQQQAQRQAQSHFFSLYVTERQCLELFDASQGAILVPFCGEHAILPAE